VVRKHTFSIEKKSVRSAPTHETRTCFRLLGVMNTQAVSLATSASAAWKAGAGSSNSVSVSLSKMSRTTGAGSSISVSVTGP